MFRAALRLGSPSGAETDAGGDMVAARDTQTRFTTVGAASFAYGTVLIHAHCHERRRQRRRQEPLQG